MLVKVEQVEVIVCFENLLWVDKECCTAEVTKISNFTNYLN